MKYKTCAFGKKINWQNWQSPIFGNDIAQDINKQFWLGTPQVLQGGWKNPQKYKN